MKYILIILITILPFSVFAQSNYYPGYVLKNNGDTLKGYIDYHEWTRSPKSINFRAVKTDKVTEHFDPQSIKGFKVTGTETYVSYSGLISTGTNEKNDLSKLSNGIDTGKIADTVFLKQIVTGRNLTLFYEGDDNKTRYFVAESGGTPLELNYYEYINESSALTKSSIFKGQLLLYANKFRPGNEELISRIEQSIYNLEDLQNIVNDINGNKVTAKRKISTRFFTGIGINKTATETGNSALYGGTQTSASTLPTVSAGIDIFGNPTVQQLIFRTELTLSSISAKFNGVTINRLSSIDPFSFHQYTATIAPQLLLNIYNKTNFKFYLDIGVGFNFSTYDHNFATMNGVDYTLSGFWFTLPIQAGIVVQKNIEVCFIYTPYADYTPYATFYVKSQNTSLGVKYLFGK